MSFVVFLSMLVRAEDFEQVELPVVASKQRLPPLYDINNIKITDFIFELLMIVTLMVYTIKYLSGKRTNKLLARKWYKKYNKVGGKR